MSLKTIKMDIAKWAGYFHDGSLINFKHGGNKIEISMLSAEIISEHMTENMPPLNKNRITGKLYLDGIKNQSKQRIFYWHPKKNI